MIFPIDVHRKATNTKKLVGQDRTAVFMQLFFFANVVCFFVLRVVLSSLIGAGIVVVLIVQLAIFIVVGITLFRYVVFREDEKIREYNNYEGDSFTKYLYLRKDSEEVFDINKLKVCVFEYENETATCTMCFRFGSNDNVKAKHTRLALEHIIGLVNSMGFEIRFVNMPENFKNSIEFKQHVAGINSVEDKNLAKNLRDILDENLKTSYAECNVDVMYMTIRSVASYQRYELESVLRGILKTLEESVNCFRSVTFLEMDELLEFYKEFYTVAAIDLARMRALDLAGDLDDRYKKVVALYSLRSTEGKTYRADKSLEQVFNVSERRI